MLSGKQFVIFDMDGTLIDSVAMWNKVDVRLVKAIADVDISEQTAQQMRDYALSISNDGYNPYLRHCEIVKSTFDVNLDAQDIYKMRYAIARDMQENEIDYKKNADTVIKRLKQLGFTLCIASTTNRDNLEVYRLFNKSMMQKANIDEHFSFIFTREDAQRLKPYPDIYLNLMEKLHAEPSQCLVFEDSLVGIEAARSAGIETVAIYDKQSDGDREQINKLATYVCNTFDDFINATNLWR